MRKTKLEVVITTQFKRDFKQAMKRHILPDWLLIYRVENDVLVLTLSRTGTHSNLFGK